VFLQCFDTVGWVIWPVKTRPHNMTYNVFGGTLSLTQSIIWVASVSYKYLLKVDALALFELTVEQVAPVGVLFDRGRIPAPSSVCLDVSTLVLVNKSALPWAHLVLKWVNVCKHIPSGCITSYLGRLSLAILNSGCQWKLASGQAHIV